MATSTWRISAHGGRTSSAIGIVPTAANRPASRPASSASTILVDNVYGDRNLICTCQPVESYAEAAE
ncbi:hypothetical protein ACC817_24025 [Rhizobium ruizarguesonis]|uniref:hypothetical protein n=1 Tax=Rhizobium ruizarguesonis TaxID=2081791 RepID=UPI0013EE6D69|nr:hypothetical protein [Rhizobium ruizarguesonis]